jgi:putative ABC transport system permease protein
MQELKVAFFLAVRSIARAQKSASILLVFILFLSYLNLMFITGILAGVSAAIVQQSIETTTSYVDVDPQQAPVQQTFIPDERDLRTRIETIPGVVATARHYSATGSIAYDRDKNGHTVLAGAPIVGIDPQEEKRVTSIAQYMVSGDYLDENDTDKIVLGADVSGGYGPTFLGNLGGAKTGEKVQVTYPNGVNRIYTVKGIYKVGFASQFAYVSFKEIESVLSVSNYASEILVNVDPSYRSLDEYKNDVQQVAPNLKVSTYEELLGQIQPISLAFEAIGFVVSVVSVMVAAITIFVLIYVNAISKRRQIGILKAIGIKQNVIILSYVFQSFFFACCGVAVGTLVVFAGLDPYLRANPILLPLGLLHLSFTPLGIVLSIASILVAGIVAGAIPSWRVARQNIIAAIWGA